MEDQNKKISRWIIGGGLSALFIIILETLIATPIFKNNTELWRSHVVGMILITMFIYLIISVIKLVKYQKFAKNFKQEKLEKTSKELTKEFKPVVLNYSKPISKDLFECQAKVGDDGKIVCKIQLDYEVKIENYEEFLSFFHIQE